MPFHNRGEAGRLLAEKLDRYARSPDLLVLGLPRGGVPVAEQVARRLDAPLDVFVVRKLGLPGQEELAMGAIASGGIRVLNTEIVQALHIPESVVEAVAAREHRELLRREQAYGDHRPAPKVQGRIVILVDDGIATGSTMRAAVAALRKMKARRIVVAAPTVSPTTFREMESVADEVVAVMVPDDFRGVGEWYEDFAQTSDAEVCEILASAARRSREEKV